MNDDPKWMNDAWIVNQWQHIDAYDEPDPEEGLDPVPLLCKCGKLADTNIIGKGSFLADCELCSKT